MKALQYHEYGGPEVLKFEDAPVPEPGPGEVLVKVSGSGINPVDWKIREGKNKDQMPAHFPQVVNREFSGTIAKLGQGVEGYKVGDPIYGIGKTGTCAEYVVAKQEAFAHAPATMELPATGGIPLAAMTAWQGLFDLGGLTAGQKVLIQAATGGVGTFAVQFAKYAGAFVYATASANRLDIVQELGADRPIDYKSERFEDIAKNVDVVLDLIGGETGIRSLKCLKPGGVLVSSVHDAPVKEAAEQGKRAVNLTMQPSPTQLDRFSSMIQDLKLKPLIDAIVPFDRAIDAENQVQLGHSLGKIVIDVQRETIGV